MNLKISLKYIQKRKNKTYNSWNMFNCSYLNKSKKIIFTLQILFDFENIMLKSLELFF